MPARKNNWLNAKPMTKTGGSSGGARNPAKPYQKPSTSSKTKPAASKPKPKVNKPGSPWDSPAPKNSRTNANNNASIRGRAITDANVDPKNYLPNSQRRGINLPKVANTAVPPKSGPSLRGTTPSSRTTTSAKPAATSPKPAVKANTNNPFVSGKPNLGAAARGVIGATSAAGRLVRGVGRLAGPAGIAAAMAGEVKAMSDRNKTFSWNRPKVKPDANGRSSRGVRVSDTANRRDYQAAPTGSQQYNDYRNQQIAAERERLKGVGNPPSKPKPKPTPPTQDRGASTQTRSNGGSGSSRSTPSAPRRIPSPASDAGMKNQDKNYRGNLFEKTFGYKAGNAPDQQQARTNNLSNKFGQDSGYQPQTKVDGSQYTDKKPDMAKVKEYDRRKRRYYS